MAKRKRTPKYGRHKGRNLARVIIDGQHICLGSTAALKAGVDMLMS